MNQLQFVSEADEIMVIRDGAVAEVGSYEELMKEQCVQLLF